MKIEFAPVAIKNLGKVPVRDRAALIEKIKDFAAGNLMTPKVVKAFPSTTWRIRHGDWRAVYRIDVESDTLRIESAAHRREVYE